MQRLTTRLAAALALLAMAGPLVAQPAAPVRLRITPAIGDTIRSRLEQEVAMKAVATVEDADSTVTMESWMATTVLLRHVVEGRDARGALVLTIIDSVAMKGDGVAMPTEAQRRVLQGRHVRTRVSPEGATAMVEGADALGADIGAMFASMPATLPDYPVKPRDTWQKTMRIPLAGGAPDRAEATVHTTFRLDSLTRRGVAWVSMRGRIVRDGAPGAPAEPVGTITGALVLDTARGWVTDSRTTIHVKSHMPASPGNAPMSFQLRMTQRLRALEPR